LIAVAFFLPGRTKDLSAPPRIGDIDIGMWEHM